MVLALISTGSAVCFTGWLYTTDRFWGYGWLANLHHGLAWALLGLAGLHVLGVLFTSLQERQNLLLSMVTGRKVRRTSSTCPKARVLPSTTP
jgi:cytochrome b